MQWKALEYLCKLNDSAKETYRLNSCPPVVKELANFEKKTSNQ